ncbi:hypothetical protein REBECCA_66 [Erwinia phage Rebecca]|uniref:Uncharacterized protein n=1 Tax=Erwinia phage Rebecca TaxID=2530026 RepID=A0A482IJY3_9CAUD|nr:hypothetical protein REBECCA_66 [Erwinia phage Rebecca]
MQNLNDRIFANYNGYIEAIDAHFKPTYQLQLAEQVIPAEQMDKLVTWMDHNAHVKGATVYLMELVPDLDKPHPAQSEMRVFIALGMFNREVNPDLPYWCHVHRHYPVNLAVDLIVTDLQGVPVTHAVLTAFKSFDRARTYRDNLGGKGGHQPHHEIHTGIIDQSGKVIFEAYGNINWHTKNAIRLLAERQILQEDTELSAVWLLAGLKAGVNWKVEDHVDIMKAIDTFRPRNTHDFNGYV